MYPKTPWILPLFCLSLLALLLGMPESRAQQAAAPYEVKVSDLVYKEIGGHKLSMTVYQPVAKDGKELKDMPAILFFHGGGWNIGSRKLFDKQARYLASRGVVAFSPDYRLAGKHKTTVAECVKDGKSAVRFVRQNAGRFGVSVDKIVASGASAGGHVAASTALVEGYDEATDNLSVSAMPSALALFCPAVRIEHEKLNDGYRQRFAGQEEQLSPYNHVKKGLPPTLVMGGTKDTQVKIGDLREFTKKMVENDNDCQLVEYEGQGHAFARFDRSPESFKQSLGDTEAFLDRLYRLPGDSWLDAYTASLKQ